MQEPKPDEESEPIIEEHPLVVHNDDDLPTSIPKIVVEVPDTVRTCGVYMVSMEEIPAADHIALSTSDSYFVEDKDAFRLHIVRTLMDIVCHEIKRLTPPQQDVIERHYLMEQKVADIERALHINSQSVIDRRDRALATLRMRLRNNPFAVELFNQLEDSDDFPLLKKLYKP
jgi:hypothetical protein